MTHCFVNRHRRPLTRLLLVAFAAIVIAPETLPAADPLPPAEPSLTQRPNIIVVLCDDLGYGDLACYGHPRIKSPHIDRFAAESLKLTSCYAAAPNCSPSRTGLMTGRTPTRVGVHNWIPMFSPMHVRKQEITIATLLRQSGYATCQVGKWHLNGRFNLVGQPQPPDHGFDYWFATQNNALPTHENPDNFVRNGKPVGRIEGYAAHIVTDEAIHWLTEVRDREKPFFLYCCYHEPHEPIASDPKYRALYDAPEDSTLPNHHGNVTQMDDAFGRLLATLDEQQLRDNTLVIFTSDNGPAITSRHPHGSAGPLRDKKGYVYDGGIRVPGLIRWPGHIEPGTVSDVPVSGVDLLPTLCDLTDTPVPADRTLDGTSIAPLFAGKPIERKQPLYWQFNASRGEPKVALRDGEWKILATLTVPSPKPYGDIRPEDQQSLKQAELDTFELYRIGSDISESQNIAADHPEELARLSKQLRAIYHDVREESPSWPAWTWPRFEGQRISNYYRQQREAAERGKKQQ